MKKLLLTSLVGLATYSASAALLINFDANRERSGFGGATMSDAAVLGESADVWNGLTAGSSGEANVTGLALTDALGAATGVTLTTSGLSSNWTHGQFLNAVLDPSSAAQTLRYDWARTSASATFTLSGLPTGQAYELVLYTGQSGGEYSLGGDTRTLSGTTAGWGADVSVSDPATVVTDLTLDEGLDYTIYTGTIDGTGTLSFNLNNISNGSNGDGDGLSGFQLAVAIPEPRTYALLLGGLALGLVAWRRRLC